MIPILIEVPAEQLDLAKDTLKAIVVLVVYALVSSRLMDSAMNWSTLGYQVLSLAAGMMVSYAILPNFVRIVVQRGDERYYHTLQKYQP